jgi:hypothetical protein
MTRLLERLPGGKQGSNVRARSPKSVDLRRGTHALQSLRDPARLQVPWACPP